ncbi:MAG: NADH-quinone oxidoreductase subunit E [Cyanobacteria bacterium K_DeepCast_35m_m2_023]|nr:NADH-quinone oxidoreductase subunit E [Cyanobacteria bacterium K_DeepCast_35m_m2_023]
MGSAAPADALIERLHALQQGLGYLPASVLAAVARELALPLSRVQGVASFYHLFVLPPPLLHRCGVCLGTACQVRGAAALLVALEQRLGVGLGQGAGAAGWSLDEQSCLGACSFGPLLLVDGALARCLPVDDQDALAERLDAVVLNGQV